MTGSWSVVYPHRRTPWAAVAADGVTPARFHPESGRVERADPNADPALPGLPTALAMGRLVSYRPGRRAVVAAADGNAYIKVVKPDKMRAVADRHLAMADMAKRAGLRAPRLRWSDEETGLLAIESLQGTTLHSSLWTVSPAEMASLGAALARLSLLEPSETLQQGDHDAGWWHATVARWDPAVEAAMLDRIERLLHTAPESAGVAAAHCDLHDKNVIVCPGSFGLIDLDGAALADRRTDLVSLIAHIELRAIQSRAPDGMRDRQASSLLAGFREIAEVTGVESSVAGELARLACVYRFRRAGRALTASIVARAEALVEQVA